MIEREGYKLGEREGFQLDGWRERAANRIEEMLEREFMRGYDAGYKAGYREGYEDGLSALCETPGDNENEGEDG